MSNNGKKKKKKHHSIFFFFFGQHKQRIVDPVLFLTAYSYGLILALL